MALNNVLGRPVVGDDFFDRDQDLARIWRRLENDNILLLAPRRVGKTSLLHRVEQTAEQHGIRAVYVSAADRSREIDFIIKLYEAIGRLESGGKAVGAALRRLGRRLPRLRKIEIAKVGWPIPYHLQLVFSALVDLGRPRPSVADAERAYEGLLGPARKAHFDWWVQRLQEELGKVDADHALEMLAAVARAEAGASRSVLTELLRGRGLTDERYHRFLLDVLENDGYLVVDDGRHVFRSPLLRDYWRTRVLS